MVTASKYVAQRLRCSSLFVAQLPTTMDNIIGLSSAAKDDDAEVEDADQRIGRYADRMFNEAAKKVPFSPIKSLLRLKATVGESEENEYSAAVALSSSNQDLPDRACSFEAMNLPEDKESALHQHANSSAINLIGIGTYRYP